MTPFALPASDGVDVACYHWPIPNPIAAVHIAHGMGEHAQRYDAVAKQLNAAGYSVYANDHRGHGETGKANLGYMGPDGWNRVLADAYELNRYIANNEPNRPIILLGHSMGSMLAQQYITRYGASISALVLSGSPGFKAKSRNPIPGWILKYETRRMGFAAGSTVMQKLLFGAANKAFDGPNASGFEWLSRDQDQVQNYLDDSRCGFVIATGSLAHLYSGAASASNPQCIAHIPKALPVYIFSGADDPVHGAKEDILRMEQAYRDAGLTNLTVKWYEGGRHEMFNETNTSEVVADLVSWMHGCVGSSKPTPVATESAAEL